MNIFANNKNANLRAIIEENPSANYKLVEAYLVKNRKFFTNYIAYRTSLGLAYMPKDKLIWELINMLDESSDDFEL